MAYVMVQEEAFTELLAAKAATSDDALLVAMGDPVLLDGYGEVFCPTVISVPVERLSGLNGPEDLPELDCE